MSIILGGRTGFFADEEATWNDGGPWVMPARCWSFPGLAPTYAAGTLDNQAGNQVYDMVTAQFPC